MKTMLLRKDIVFIGFVGALTTVFITDSYLWQGFITAKYFWFSAIMCVVSLLIPLQFSKKNEIHISDVLFGIFSFYICINFFCLNGHPNMQWWLTLLMIPLYVAVRSVFANEKLRRWLPVTVLVVVLAEAMLGLLQLYGLTHSHHVLYRITGTLFNPGPYSGFVAVGVPLALGFSLDKAISRRERWLGMATLLFAILVLPATMSRAAWIAAITGCVPVLANSMQESRTFRSTQFIINRLSKPVNYLVVIAICILVVALFAGAYMMKKDSADGRWVIWSVSMEPVKERPLFGAGYGRYAAVYGEAQAAYFLSGKGNEVQAMIADSPGSAFNEYVQIAVELGIVGLVLFLLTVGSTFVVHRFSAIHASLVAFLVFSVFSYPFSVLPLGILFVFLLALSAPASRKLSLTIPLWLRVMVVAVCWGITAYGAFRILPKRAAYRDWSSSQILFQIKSYYETAQAYAPLYSHLRHEKYFLFEYGQCLSKTGQYTESNRIFEEYLCYGSDPMVYNCMGNNFKEMGEYERAENMYLCASQIVPNRHYPLYLLMKLYQDTGQTGKAKSMADALLNKPVKVQSTAIREMQEEAERVKSEE